MAATAELRGKGSPASEEKEKIKLQR
ncbi:hypothetical protein A2U01_0079457, partial [Trifolium medium]|nr:hypothetical protein [Trifolium medium]